MDRENQWDRTTTFLCYKNMQKKHTKAKITALKNTYFTEMLHIDISVVKPAATAQISLKFRGQKKNKKPIFEYSRIPLIQIELVCIRQKKESGQKLAPQSEFK